MKGCSTRVSFVNQPTSSRFPSSRPRRIEKRALALRQERKLPKTPNSSQRGTSRRSVASGRSTTTQGDAEPSLRYRSAPDRSARPIHLRPRHSADRRDVREGFGSPFRRRERARCWRGHSRLATAGPILACPDEHAFYRPVTFDAILSLDQSKVADGAFEPLRDKELSLKANQRAALRERFGDADGVRTAIVHARSQAPGEAF